MITAARTKTCCYCSQVFTRLNTKARRSGQTVAGFLLGDSTMQILPQPPIADEATAERVIEWFLAGYEPLLFAADLGLAPEQVIDQIRWTLAQYVRKLSRKGTGRKPIGVRPMTSTERARKTRKKKQQKKAIG